MGDERSRGANVGEGWYPGGPIEGVEEPLRSTWRLGLSGTGAKTGLITIFREWTEAGLDAVEGPVGRNARIRIV